MAKKQTKGQQETVERVMHEFKHDELKSGSGRKVKNRKQAVAIALNEAGASKYESPKQNEKSLRRTKAKERKGETAQAAAEGKKASGSKEPTKSELYARAKRRDIPGRSKMNKGELERALSA